MSVLKPRNRLINFRLTEEEFAQLRDSCRQQGARSVSDFARAAVLGQVENPRTKEGFGRLEQAILQLDARVGHLASLLESGGSAG
jgi:hypothetical protein